MNKLGNKTGKRTPDSKTVGVRMPVSLYEKIKERAGENGISEFIRAKLEAIVD